MRPLPRPCPGRYRPLLRQVTLAQGVLFGRALCSEPELRAAFTLDALLQNIIDSSAIEGETLNVGSVRSSIARRLGLADSDSAPVEPRAEGLAQIMLDATTRLDAPLTESRLLQWHAWLFAGEDGSLDPLLRAALAHFWFVTLHPFDDGNGRITRALTDLALAQGERQSIRFHAMSAAILADRKGYYAQLETAQKMHAAPAPMDLTPWLHWFLATLLRAIESASAQIDRVLAKSRFWHRHRAQVASPEQVKVLNRLLDGDQRGRGGFEHGISAAQYQAVAKVSKATATRHLADLVAKGCLEKPPGGGRSTRYQIRWPAVGDV